ncbi:DUF6056 family protein [Companilactobacillus halodurans]|uniref:Teichoic acid polysaccharide export protein n=1 Tax=Companilactobacillus halodurans TaxID=2584183 RepID=A0A5P0ZYF1_9LACO|nr:DUF6056 family protein [Companilactobacillus halodurans]MQS75902.1 hypothetical protein [Companilactobacillus halodurans]MQS98069.1 hypothetical protein [Companilactobacillus halodurans]
MPLLGDDLHWGTYFGSNYFPNGIFLKYDGRYLGDFLVILLTKIRPVAFIAYGTFVTAIVYLIQKIRDQIATPKSLGLVSSTLMATFLLIMPKTIFKQTLGWHSGFSNYVTSAIFPLLMLFLILKNYDNKEVHYYRTSVILIFIGSIAAQFFAEHITVLNVINGILIWIFLRKHFGKRFQKILKLTIAGNIIGAFLMFINKAYITVLTGKDSYRSLDSKNSGNMIHYFETMDQKKLILLLGALLIFTIAIILYTLKLKNKKQKIANFALLWSGYVAVLPFAVVSPFGSRCTFATYLFLIAIVIINFDLLLSAYEKFILPIVTIISLALGLRMDLISHDYHKTFNMQIQYSLYQNSLKRNTQYFPQYKNTDYIWATSPIQSDTNFAELYVTNKNRQMLPISYNDWTSIANKLNKKHIKNPTNYMKKFDKEVIQKENN